MKLFNKNDYQEQLTNDFEKNVYNYIYVSLGGKINETTVNFQHPNTTQFTNALYQMVPTFIQSGEKILCIIFFTMFSNVYLCFRSW